MSTQWTQPSLYRLINTYRQPMIKARNTSKLRRLLGRVLRVPTTWRGILAWILILIAVAIGASCFVQQRKRGDESPMMAHAMQGRLGKPMHISIDLGSLQPMSPVMYGAFFEEINHAGEGGLNPELLRDRSFEAFAYITNKGYETSSGGMQDESTRSQAHSADDALEDKVARDPFRHPSALQTLSMDPTGVASAGMDDSQAWSFSENLKVEVEEITPPKSSTATAKPKASSAESNDNDEEKLKEEEELEEEFGADAPGAGGLHAVRLYLGSDNKLTEAYATNHGHSLKGFHIQEGHKYVVQVRARSADKTIASLGVSLTAADGVTVHARHLFTGLSRQWDIYSTELTPLNTDSSARLQIRLVGQGTLDLDYVSLTPAANWAVDGTYYPFDKQLVRMLKELKPAFLRFPGGAYLEGVNMSNAYRWKMGVGPAQLRPGHPNANWGYWSTDALGLYEFMQLCEELNTEPVWVVNVGISQSESVPPSGLRPWELDMLHGLEFIKGKASTRWGKIRAALGHPQPWKLNYITIGNEECKRKWYKQHYTRFAKLIRARYPNLQIIANCDLGDDADFDAWEMHSYRDPVGTFRLRQAVDNYEGRPVAVTEFAAMGEKEDIRNAVAEAGFMSSLERNCQKVSMVAYAPLLAHAALRTWRPDLIVFDGKGGVYGTPSYIVQQMYRQYMGTHCAAVRMAGYKGKAPFSELDESLEASATCLDGSACLKVALKLINFQEGARTVHVTLQRSRSRGLRSRPRWLMGAKDEKALMMTMAADGLSPESNSFEDPDAVQMTISEVDVSKAGPLVVKLRPYSLSWMVVHMA